MPRVLFLGNTVLLHDCVASGRGNRSNVCFGRWPRRPHCVFPLLPWFGQLRRFGARFRLRRRERNDRCRRRVRGRLGSKHLKRHAADMRLKASNGLLAWRGNLDQDFARRGQRFLAEFLGKRLDRLPGLLHRKRLIAEETNQFDPTCVEIHLREQLFLLLTGERNFRRRRRLGRSGSVHGFSFQKKCDELVTAHVRT